MTRWGFFATISLLKLSHLEGLNTSGHIKSQYTTEGANRPTAGKAPMTTGYANYYYQQAYQQNGAARSSSQSGVRTSSTYGKVAMAQGDSYLAPKKK